MSGKRILDVAKDGYEIAAIEDGRYIRSRVQNTDSYYKENQFLRDNIKKEVVNRRWALPIAQIPYADYQELIKRNPALKHTDARIRTAAWYSLLRTSATEQFRTVRKNLIPGSQNPDLGSTILPGVRGKKTGDAADLPLGEVSEK